MIFVLQPAADAAVDPEYQLRCDNNALTNIGIQDCRSYGGGFFVNEYGPSTNLDPSDPSYRANDVWMRPLGEFKTLERAKAAALEYYKSQTEK